MKKCILVLIVCVIFCGSSGITLGLSFTPGHFYATDDYTKTIYEYNNNGQILSSMIVPVGGDEIAGIAFGPDGLMYGVVDGGAGTRRTDVVAFDSNGIIRRTYNCTNFSVSSNISYGKIDFGSDGNFYIAGASGIARFNMFDTSSFYKIPNTALNFDVQVLPNNNLLIADSYDIKEIDTSGNLIRTIGRFVDIRGLEYDAVGNNIYVSTLGQTGAYCRIYKIDGVTNQIKNNAYFEYADDLFITREYQLLVGSRTQSPGLFSMDLNYIKSLQGSEQLFVTQYIPEPATLSLLAFGAVALLRKKK